MRRFRVASCLALLLGVVGIATAATVEVTVSNFRYTPNDVTLRVGDSVRWVNVQGVHDVVADDNAFRSGAAGTGWTYTRQFNQVGDTLYHCSVHSSPGQPINSAMNGRVRVLAADFAINQGIAGTWFEPATAGQGFLVDVEPVSKFLFVAWFTYDVPAAGTASKLGAPEQRWFTAQGNYTGGAATLQVFQSSGGAFDVPRTTSTTQVGTLQLRFDSCTAGSAQYAIPGAGLSGEIALQRAIPGTEVLCAMLNTPQ
jgi:plastocyanin